LEWLKAYDVRGTVPEQLDPGEAYRIGLAFAQVARPVGPVAVGHDIRLSSPALAKAVISGLNDGGVDTRELGQCGTEMVYFACAQSGMGGGIMVTASHNPANYNGMKLVAWDLRRRAVKALTRPAGLLAIEELVRTRTVRAAKHRGRNERWNLMPGYLDTLLSFVRGVDLEPLTIVCNAGNGGAGLIMDEIAPHLPFEIVPVYFQPDGAFPNGVPNPLANEASNAATVAAVKAHGAAFGVAWDGDFDRCFLFDETGAFVDGYYIVGLLASQMLAQHGGGKIIHDPRLFWNTLELVAEAGGEALRSKTGHARIKELMVASGAIYGGEMSAHHYFRDFASCDTGMAPWLVVAALISQTGRKLSELVGERVARFPCSGERNRKVVQAQPVFAAVERHFAAEQPAVDRFDGLSLAFGDRWRFNLRESDTEEGQMRLNVEAREDVGLVAEMTAEILRVIDAV
jgi:phosphomannomutase